MTRTARLGACGPVGHLLVGRDHQPPAGQRQAGVGGPAVPAQVRHLARPGDVGDIQHHHARVVVTEVAPAVGDQRVVGGVPAPGGPAGLLVLPLAGPPPAGGLGRPGRVGQVEHHPDPVAEMVGNGGKMCVTAAPPDDPVHPAPAAGPERDPLGPQRVAEAVDGQPGRERLGHRRAVGELLVVDQQQAIGGLHLVVMAAGRRPPLCHQLRPGGVGHVQDRGAHPGGARVPDVEHVALPDHLHAVAVATQVVAGEQAQPAGARGPGPRPRWPPGHAGVVWPRLTRAPSRSAAQSAVR